MARDKLHPRTLRVALYPDQIRWLTNIIAASRRDEQYVSEAAVVRAAIDELSYNGGYEQIRDKLLSDD